MKTFTCYTDKGVAVVCQRGYNFTNNSGVHLFSQFVSPIILKQKRPQKAKCPKKKTSSMTWRHRAHIAAASSSFLMFIFSLCYCFRLRVEEGPPWHRSAVPPAHVHLNFRWQSESKEGPVLGTLMTNHVTWDQENAANWETPFKPLARWEIISAAQMTVMQSRQCIC